MEREKNVVVYYALCNVLKNVVRTGWKNWHVKRDRLESVAEHIFGTQMLALAMWSEYEYKIDIKKVLFMLAIHELEEIVIGDLTLFQIDKQKKQQLGHLAIKKILKNLKSADEIESLILEFDAKTTPEAKFAYWCDKLECDLQCKLYDEENCVDLTKQDLSEYTPDVAELLKTKSWSGMWLSFGRNRYGYDKNFEAVSLYAEKNNLKKLAKKPTDIEEH